MRAPAKQHASLFITTLSVWHTRLPTELILIVKSSAHPEQETLNTFSAACGMENPLQTMPANPIYECIPPAKTEE